MESDQPSERNSTKPGWQSACDAIQLRLRFLIAISALAIVAALWPWMTNAWERVLARIKPFVLDAAVSANTEFFCPMDPGVLSTWPAICPICNMDLIPRGKSESPILPDGVLARMQLSPYRIALAGVRTIAVQSSESIDDPNATVTSWKVPLTSLVHWGEQSVVYVESMPGMFDGIPVNLLRRDEDSYIVEGNLKSGQQVVAMGTLLIDAETRLHPHLSTQYFGAASQATASPPPPVQRVAKNPVDTLDRAEMQLAEAQRYCPVTQAPLGSMGSPVFVQIGERKIALCCKGCCEPLLASPEKYLSWLDERLASEREPK